MPKKLQVIPKHNKTRCWICSGKGKVENETCLTCEGTGMYIDTFYYMVYKGMCFGVDTIK